MADGVVPGGTDRLLGPGAAHELTLVVADSLEVLEARHAARSIDEQITLLATPALIPQLCASIPQHSYSGVLATCGDLWLLAVVLVLKSKALNHAQQDWLLAGASPSPALFGAAKALCGIVPSLRHLAGVVQRLEARGE